MLEAAARRLTRRSGPNRDVGDYEPETQRSSTLPYGRTSTTLQPTPRLAGHQSAKSSPTTYLQQTDYFQSEPLQLRHPAHNTSLNQDLAPSTSREQQHPESCSCQICRTKSDANAHANYARKLGEWFSSFPATLEHINRGHDDLVEELKSLYEGRLSSLELSKNKEINDLIQQATEWSNQASALKAEVAALNSQVKDLGQEKADLRREVDRLRDDVRYAEQFLSKPNQVPETALTEKLGDINDKISEIAGIASKLHSHQALPIARSSSGPLFPAKVAQILGKELVTALETKPHNSSAKFVQMALQSILLDLVRDIFNAQWCDLAVVKTSEYIKTTEVQAISARWRVLASRAHRAHPDAKRRHLESWAETSVKSIAELLSKTTGKSDIAKLEKTCQEKLFSRHLTALGTLVFDLMGIAQESITDHDYKVSIVPAGSKYDAQTMVQKGSPPPPAGAHAVLCPMGLGMRRVVSTVSNTPRPHNSRIIPSPPEEFTIMLPEVLLPYTVNDSPGPSISETPHFEKLAIGTKPFGPRAQQSTLSHGEPEMKRVDSSLTPISASDHLGSDPPSWEQSLSDSEKTV